MTGMLDCLIVGGGPGGLTAAIYLVRFRRNILVVDEAKSRCSWIPTSHNHAGFMEGINGIELLERMRCQARQYGTRIETGSIASLCRLGDRGFRATTADGVELDAETVILATGVIDDQPRLPNLFDTVQRGLIRVCPICDAYEVIDTKVAVIGHGRDALGEVLFIRGYTSDLTLLTLGTPMNLTADDRAKLSDLGVAIVEEQVERVTEEAGRITKVILKSGTELAFDTLYSALGTLARSTLAGQLGAEMNNQGRLVVDSHCQTSIPGFYAVGDVVEGLNQISVSMGQAAVAATAIHNLLRRRDGLIPPGRTPADPEPKRTEETMLANDAQGAH
ncbi:NAD(P)/FAD-dependent oxidoreductase [Skermanella mucosa]|uniref:NAD(P)/FAD-dependent oxidoreductase n=1 Tax=Skermanella mucosa TaxID=1789672 RepID=UPI00192CC0A7|nr:NAD(P)/FAD-dependent oxidoreductase [Skermanella mucosa]UEM22052.1 NAD(P)/FAD-dependent oxidoreductase [Skermanella mucosa]